MSQFTEDPSSGGLVQRLAKNYKNDSIVSVTWTRSVLWQHIVTRCACVQFTVYEGIYSQLNTLSRCGCVQFSVYAFTYSELHTLTTGQNMPP